MNPRRALSCLAFVTLLLPVAQLRAIEFDGVVRLQFPPGTAQLIVRQAIEGAVTRLDDPICRQVLTDFTDATGMKLAARLMERQRTPAEFLKELWFIEAGDDPMCSTTSTAAFTTPGSRVVYVCSAWFASAQSTMSGAAGQIVMIHELLHALGLPERPSTLAAPSSAEITKRVWARCGTPNWSRIRTNVSNEGGLQTKTWIRSVARPGFIR